MRILLLVLAMLAFTGCGFMGDVVSGTMDGLETAAEAGADAAEDTGEFFDDAAEDVVEFVEDAADDVEDFFDEAF